MGWLFFAHYGRSNIELLKRELVQETDITKWTWIDHSERGATVYAVIQVTPKSGERADDKMYVPDPDGSVRIIAVLLTQRSGGEFGYKVVDESMGPVEKECPQRLLKVASPLRDEYQGWAREWREACMNASKIRREAKAKAPKPGQRFRTLRPVTFSGLQLSEFQCVIVERRGRKNTLYTSPKGVGYYRFKPENYGFEIIESG